MVALRSATANGQTIFGKNSDRPADECQPLIQHPRRTHAPGAVAHCQFLDIPEAPVTYRHIGSRPYWCWGYEQGFNEHQVVIGNEAVYSRFPQSAEPKLVGMEILRLGLERGRSAAEAVAVMTDLITRYGQGKFANDAGVVTYDNGYIVADPHEAYVIETAGHEWAVERVEGTRSIGNIHSIGTDSSILSPTAERNARANGWWQSGSGRFDFGAPYAIPRDRAAALVMPVALDASENWSVSDCQRRLEERGVTVPQQVIADLISHRHDAPWRRARSGDLLRQHTGSITAGTLMAILSDHADGHSAGAPLDSTIRPGRGSICVHRALDEGGGNTAASLVADLCADGSRLPVYWCCFYSPCLGLFLPVFIEGELPAALSQAGAASTDRSPWWEFRELNRAVYANIDSRVPVVRQRWAPLQARLLESAYDVACQARRLIDSGQPDEATRLLTGYMTDNTDAMLSTVKELRDELCC